MELEKAGPIDTIEKNQLQYFYDRIFMNRIGIRTLIYQHSKMILFHIVNNWFLNKLINLALLYGNELPQHPQQAGIIDPECDVARVVKGKILLSKLWNSICHMKNLSRDNDLKVKKIMTDATPVNRL